MRTVTLRNAWHILQTFFGRGGIPQNAFESPSLTGGLCSTLWLFRPTASSKFVHQRAAHRVAGQFDPIGFPGEQVILVAEIIVQIFEAHDPVARERNVKATAERP